mgnify:CR=1 FL=1
MICKVCGTNNEDYLEYCKKCSAPLHGSDNADNGAEAPASPRSFVRSPFGQNPNSTPILFQKTIYPRTF